MSLPALTIIPAGAGSGKTYTIQKRLSEWIRDGKVQPERIVAVTFTEAAAGELRERIRVELIRSGHPEHALKLDQAIITTIHGFGLRVLTEFCFVIGALWTVPYIGQRTAMVISSIRWRRVWKQNSTVTMP